MERGSVGFDGVLSPLLETTYNPERPGHNQATGTTKKTYFFAILAIVGFGGLVVGVVGLVQVLQSGALTNQAIIMMATGGAGGTLLLIIGIVGLVKNCQRAGHQPEHTDPNIPVQPNRMRQTEFIKCTAVGSIRDMQRFGKVEWERYFGAVPEEPPLPDSLHEILNAPCPFSGDDDVKVKDTHMLVLIPATVRGEALTLNKLRQLIQNPLNNGHRADYSDKDYDQNLQHAHGATEINQSYWVLMTKEVIPGSRRKTYNEQKELIRPHEEIGYTLPGALEAAVCILMEYVVSSKRLFSQETETLTRCSEIVLGKSHVVVGDFGPNSNSGSNRLLVYYSTYNFSDHCLGVAALRKFS